MFFSHPLPRRKIQGNRQYTCADQLSMAGDIAAPMAHFSLMLRAAMTRSISSADMPRSTIRRLSSLSDLALSSRYQNPPTRATMGTAQPRTMAIVASFQMISASMAHPPADGVTQASAL